MSDLLAEYKTDSGQVLQVRQGDLTQEDADAIVNAANSQLAHGGGVAGAIVRRGGPVIQEESDRWVHQHGPVSTGQVAVTGAGKLPAKHIIHAVGPVWHGGIQGEAELLRAAVWNSLTRAHQMELSSIALPAISSGIFGFPKERCARILVQTALDFCREYPDSPLREIRFVNIDRATAELFQKEVEELEIGD
jgi:O-acetyl-ADP-ribose deacetylase (regulator of RNase III)